MEYSATNPERPQLNEVELNLSLSEDQQYEVGGYLFTIARDLERNHTPEISIQTADDIILTEPPKDLLDLEEPTLHCLSMSRVLAPDELDGHRALIKAGGRQFKLTTNPNSLSSSKWIVTPELDHFPKGITHASLMSYITERIPGASTSFLTPLLDKTDFQDTEFTELLINGLSALAVSSKSAHYFGASNYLLQGEYGASVAAQIGVIKQNDSTLYQVRLGSQVGIQNNPASQNYYYKMLLPENAQSINDATIEASLKISSAKIKAADLRRAAHRENMFSDIPNLFTKAIQLVDNDYTSVA